MMPLQPFISEQFTGTIWRMEIDELSETLFVEIRNNEDKQVSFAAISLVNGEVYFKDITTPERWLTGIEAAYDGVLLLHNYQSEAGPTHRGVIAIDGSSGETLWSNYTFAFDYLSENGPVIYDTRIQPRKLFLADIKTGATTRLYEQSVYKVLQNNIVTPEMVTPSELPLGFLPLHPFENRIHYLEYNNFRIVSLHALKGGQLTQSLFIKAVDSPDSYREVYDDLLNAGIQKMQPEAFIMHKNRLIYIKNKSGLKVLTL
jgi:hypothetical protein